MTQIVETRRLTAGTVFKLLLAGLFVPIVGFSLICGVIALCGGSTVTVNGHASTGAAGLLWACILGPVLWILFAFGAWVTVFIGLWLYSLVRPMRITYVAR